MQFDYGNINNNPYKRYDNGYVVRDYYVELHIYSEKIDIVALIDLDDYFRVRNLFWTFSYTGKEGYKTPTVYNESRGNGKIRLNRFIEGVTDSNTVVEFLNRDPLDFRKSNLNAVHKNGMRMRASSNAPLCGVTEISGRGGVKTGYSVIYKDSGLNKTKFFSVKVYGSAEDALNNAIEFRSKFIEQQKVSWNNKWGTE